VQETEWAARPFFEQLEGKLCKRGSDERVEIDSSFLVQDDQADLRTALQTWNSAITALVSALESVGLQLVNRDADILPFHMDFQQDIDAAVGGLNEIVRETAFVLEARDNAFVYWIEKAPMRQGGARGWAAPIAVGPRLAAEVYALNDTVIFSSATLAVGDSFNFIKNRLGIDRVEKERLREVNVGTPFDYGEQCRIAVPTFLPEPDGKDVDFAALLAGFLAELFGRTRGRAMALFTSYAMLGRVADILIDNPLLADYDILVQGRSGSRESIVGCFKRDVASILLGTHSFWEGVDLVGETLSCVVVARLPFAVFTEPLERARWGHSGRGRRRFHRVLTAERSHTAATGLRPTDTSSVRPRNCDHCRSSDRDEDLRAHPAAQPAGADGRVQRSGTIARRRRSVPGGVRLLMRRIHSSANASC